VCEGERDGKGKGATARTMSVLCMRREQWERNCQRENEVEGEGAGEGGGEEEMEKWSGRVEEGEEGCGKG
jgi:hypothetical protein